jgi:hypothetical protein
MSKADAAYQQGYDRGIALGKEMARSDLDALRRENRLLRVRLAKVLWKALVMAHGVDDAAR